ncbi:MAG: hypothetical protein DSY46_05020 [Hydrogenimonas sp.]|nr:MAG: hypothetical protein DSY46_05020 [Hydrogenimonas sp.]
MLKKIALFVLGSTLLCASQFVLLENGQTIWLKDDGTYEKVTLIKRDGQMVALKKDGTWEVVPEKIVIAETVVNPKSQAHYKAKTSLLAKTLVGVWKSRDGNLIYEFQEDGTLRIKEKNRWKKTTYQIDDIDEVKRNIVVNIGESERLGFLSLGGEHWILHIDEDGQLHNLTLKLKIFKDIALMKQ